MVLFDPEPLVLDIPSEVVRGVLNGADWLSCNQHEAQRLTGERTPEAAIATLGQGGGGVVVRLGGGSAGQRLRRDRSQSSRVGEAPTKIEVEELLAIR